MDHFQVLVPDVLGTAKFYMDVGFRISDYLCIEARKRSRPDRAGKRSKPCFPAH
jgi:hypothetical protein